MVATRTRRRALIVGATAAITLPFACRVPDEHFTVRGDAASADARNPDVAVAIDAPAGPCNLSAPWGTPMPVAGLSSVNSNTRFSPDELTAYYSTDPDGSGSSSTQLYAATRADLASTFGSGTPVPNVNTPDGEASATLTNDNLTMYFTWGELPLHPAVDREIWRATRGSAGATFGSGSAVPGINASGSEDDYPSVAANGDLWFGSKRGTDTVVSIYRAPSVGGGAFGTVVRVDELDSTADGQFFPMLSPDLLTVYFERQNLTWSASRGSAGGTFTIPMPVAELNAIGSSSDRHRPAYISRDGCRLYVGLGPTGTVAMYVASKPAS